MHTQSTKRTHDGDFSHNSKQQKSFPYPHPYLKYNPEEPQIVENWQQDFPWPKVRDALQHLYEKNNLEVEFRVIPRNTDRKSNSFIESFFVHRHQNVEKYINTAFLSSQCFKSATAGEWEAKRKIYFSNGERVEEVLDAKSLDGKRTDPIRTEIIYKYPLQRATEIKFLPSYDIRFAINHENICDVKEFSNLMTDAKYSFSRTFSFETNFGLLFELVFTMSWSIRNFDQIKEAQRLEPSYLIELEIKKTKMLTTLSGLMNFQMFWTQHEPMIQLQIQTLLDLLVNFPQNSQTQVKSSETVDLSKISSLLSDLSPHFLTKDAESTQSWFDMKKSKELLLNAFSTKTFMSPLGNVAASKRLFSFGAMKEEICQILMQSVFKNCSDQFITQTKTKTTVSHGQTQILKGFSPLATQEKEVQSSGAFLYKFPGSLASNLLRHDLKVIQKEKYVALIKTDGMRALLFLTTFRGCLLAIFLNRSMQFYHVPIKSSSAEIYKGTLLDGELVFNNTLQSFEFQIFDCLSLSGKLVMGFDYFTRLQHAQEFVKCLPMNASPVCGFLVKQPIANKQELLKTDYPYPTDGIILINAARRYIPGQELMLFKWKPIESITFDFKVEWKDNGQITLYVLDHNTLKPIATVKDQKVWLDKGFTQAGANEQIVECEYRLATWSPLKIRLDKPSPNSEKTFEQTKKSLEENIQMDEWANIIYGK